MVCITVKYGLRSATRTYPNAPTVRELRNDQSLRDELGLGDNVKVLVNGVAQGDGIVIQSPVVEVENAMNTKNNRR